SWAGDSAGLASPETAWALAEFDGAEYASDAAGVYRLDGSRWMAVSQQSRVVSLDVAPALSRMFASSLGEGIRYFDGTRWATSTISGIGHGGGQAHVVSVTATGDGRLFAATSLDGVLASLDGGDSWFPLGSGPGGEVGRITADGSTLVAATDHGVFDYATRQAARPDATWWTVVLVSGFGGGAGAAGLILWLSRRRSTKAPAARS